MEFVWHSGVFIYLWTGPRHFIVREITNTFIVTLALENTVSAKKCLKQRYTACYSEFLSHNLTYKILARNSQIQFSF